MMRRGVHEDPQSRAFYELSSLVLGLLRSPPLPISFSDDPSASLVSSSSSHRRPPAQITPAGFASLMLGISLAMMLCGSVTFLIGFMLMPWVIGLLMVLYVVGIVSSISMLGRALLCHITAFASPPRKDLPEWKLL
uniref:Transmembrane protein n=1 Tax=Kalanchoe fedtschenkoi TaxID=63787 RepID=A0A7N0TNH4_KALFE